MPWRNDVEGYIVLSVPWSDLLPGDVVLTVLSDHGLVMIRRNDYFAKAL